MFLQERQAEIVNKVNNNGSVKVAELAHHFAVTEDCIRKDLQQLDKRGLVCRVYGGAVSILGQGEREITKRYSRNRDAKRIIAQKAYNLIEQNDTIFLDTSSTNAMLAEYIAKTDKRIVVYSNMLKILEMCSGNHNIKTIGVGGEVNREFDCFLGALTINNIRPLHFNKAFIGVLGANLEENKLYTFDLDDALIKHQVIENAQRSYLMCTNDKIGRDGVCEFGRVDELDTIICDAPTEQLIYKLERQGVSCI